MDSICLRILQGIMNERDAYIALNMMQGVGPVTVRKMAEHLGSVAAIFEGSDADLKALRGCGTDKIASVLKLRGSVDPVLEQDKADKLGARIVTFIDPEYPELLKTIHDPPLALYVQGTFETSDRHSIAVVGTRHATHYGMETAKRLSRELTVAGYTVISGLALGVDTSAHQAALDAKGRTIAVIGGSLDNLYPPENAGLAKKIACSGAVVSEFPLGRKPDRTTFPMRNRIVSGMTVGTLVIEAGRNSGALITANQAAEQGRQVFAVPGRVDSPNSMGCHRLLKDGAKLVESVDDILAEFEFLLRPAGKRDVAAELPMPKLSDEEKRIVEALSTGDGEIDVLIRSTGMSSAAVGSLLVGLEMKRMVKMRPGRIVELVNRSLN